MSLRSKQILTLSTFVFLTMGLFALDIRGLVKKDITTTETTTEKLSSSFDIKKIIAETKASLSKQQLGVIEKYEQQQDFVHLILEWEKVGTKEIITHYIEQQAHQQPSLGHWIKAGNSYTELVEASQDSVLTLYALQQATECYKNAIKTSPNNIEARTGLGIAYVSGQNPMDGVKLLLGVVKDSPKDIKANMSLGLFAIRSGQYDKAIKRFELLNSIKSSPDAYFYLAESYKALGRKQDAIKSYQLCKTMVKDPAFVKAIDGFINELKN